MRRDTNLISAEVAQQSLKAVLDFKNLPSDWLQQSFPATSKALRLSERSSPKGNDPATSKKISKVLNALSALSSAPLHLSPVRKKILASVTMPSVSRPKVRKIKKKSLVASPEDPSQLLFDMSILKEAPAPIEEPQTKAAELIVQPSEDQVRRQILSVLGQAIYDSLVKILKKAEIKSKEIKTAAKADSSNDKIGVKIFEIAKEAFTTFRKAEDKLPPTKNMLLKLQDEGLGILKIIENYNTLAARSHSATIKERKICEASIDLFHQELSRILPTKENLQNISELIFELYKSEISKAATKKRESATGNSASADSQAKLVKPSPKAPHRIIREELNKPKGKEISRKKAKKRIKVPIQAILGSAESSPADPTNDEISTPKEKERFPKDSPEIWPQNGGLKIRVCYLKGWSGKNNAEGIRDSIWERNFGVNGLEVEVFEILDRTTYRKLKVGSEDSEGFLLYKYDLQG